MRITPLGAAGGVTGSCYLVECGPSRVLVDCGMFQGEPEADARNLECTGINPAALDAVVLTHAHLDHCGRLPILVKCDGVCGIAGGFKQKIWATPATVDLTRIILLDSANIQEADAERENLQRERSGEPGQVQPLYTVADAERTMELFAPLELTTKQEIAPGITIQFHESGHILGSASVSMTLRHAGVEKVVVFSGDVGPLNTPLLRDFQHIGEVIDGADLVFCESTYGDRDHRGLDQTVEEFRGILEKTAWEKKKVLIPSFAVGRAQQIMYHIAELHNSGRCPRVPVYLDSPMASKATELYRTHSYLLDKYAKATGFGGDFTKLLPELTILNTVAESRVLNDSWDPGIIVASSGMCEGGRIVHHLKHNLWKKGVAIVLVGYMGSGTLGRKLVDGAREVFIQRTRIAVRANIHTLGGFSAHAGQTDLLHWLNSLAAKRRQPRIALTHGEDMPRKALAGKIADRWRINAELPMRGNAIEL